MLLDDCPPSSIDVEGPLLGGDAFYWGVSEDGVQFSILDEGTARVFG